MDLVSSLTALEDRTQFHEARLLVLLGAFSGSDGSETVAGLTKLAKLDFLLRYPTLLQRALEAKRRSTDSVRLLDHERTSVESRMVRYRFGPWDHRYRMLLNILVARGLATISVAGRAVTIGLTAQGLAVAQELGTTDEFTDIARRARILKGNFDFTATNLMRFVYETFPEILSLQKNERI